KTAKGYITANKTYVTKLVSNSDNYFTENPHQIIMRVSDKLYTDVEFSNASRTLSSGTVVPVKGIEYSSNGVPRLKTEEGYLTANKNYVTAAGNTNNNYFVTNPKKVKLLIDDSFYNNVEFTKKGQAVKKNTIVEVEAIEYTNNGIPRLKTNQGYLTANKWYVAKVG
ncbi:glycosyl hydrolase family 25, partial [Enterococcus faecalis]|nr:glycosyl hydrolase family 25 [Enterococcus faecalis]